MMTSSVNFLKIIFLGNSGVGKTTMLNYLIHDEFKADQVPTVGVDFQVKHFLTKEGEAIPLTFWDTAGQEKFRGMTKHYVRDVSAVIFVYDITKRETFQAIEEWMDFFKEGFSTASQPFNVVQLLIGNKSDIFEHRQVEMEEGMKLATTHGISFFETSSVLGTNLESVLETIVYSCLKYKSLFIQYEEQNQKLSMPLENKNYFCCF